jgi:hypothetical protein
MGDDYINQNILPFTQLNRLIRPEEIADAPRLIRQRLLTTPSRRNGRSEAVTEAYQSSYLGRA